MSTSRNPMGYQRPGNSRGFLPLLMAALSAGKAIYGAVNSNQEKQRNKGYINDAYRTASARMTDQQAEGTQGNLEALNARGLGGPARPIQAAMTNGRSSATTIGEQSQANLKREFALDRHSLDAQHERDLNENKASALNAQIGAIAGGLQGMGSAYMGGKDLAAAQAVGAAPGAAPSAAAASMAPSQRLSGGPIQGAFGIDPMYPWGIGAPKSGGGGTTIGEGQPNYSFTTGVG